MNESQYFEIDSEGFFLHRQPRTQYNGFTIAQSKIRVTEAPVFFLRMKSSIRCNKKIQKKSQNIFA